LSNLAIQAAAQWQVLQYKSLVNELPRSNKNSSESLMESRRPSKRLANAVAEEAHDRLSALLHSILRLVPLKQAVRTSALSRRWPRLWLGALAASPVLDFGDHAFTCLQPQTFTP
jgi:hypothetical protein